MIADDGTKVSLAPEQQNAFGLLFRLTVDALLKIIAHVKKEPNCQRIRIKLDSYLSHTHDFFVEKTGVVYGKENILLTYRHKNGGPKEPTIALILLGTLDQFDVAVDFDDAPLAPQPPQDAVSEAAGPGAKEGRLAFLTAIGANGIEKAKRLIAQDPELIRVKTTSKGSTALQLAVERNYEPMCQLLLSRGHETNPINDEGKTPYQWSEIKDSIKQLLVAFHSQALFKNFPLFHNTDNVLLKECDEFRTICKQLGMTDKILFARTFALEYQPESTPRIQTIFRKDALMIPHFGSLVVYQENLQSQLLIEASGKEIPPERHLASRVEFVKYGFESHPFLKERVNATDRQDIAKAKKLFLVEGIKKLVDFINDNPTAEFLLPNYKPQISEARQLLEMYDKKNRAVIYNEVMHEYG